MRNLAAAMTLLLSCLLVGCSTPSSAARTPADAALFAPVSMRIHPIFSGVKDWSGDDKPDGVEALVEFQNRFGDPTKAAGTIVFELFSYRPYNPDPRGPRLLNPWIGSLQTLADQQARWNRTSRTYAFQLEYPQIKREGSYVLAATFDTGTTRFFDQIVLEGTPRERAPATRASTTPASPKP